MVVIIFLLMMVSIGIFLSYVISMVNKYGIPASISDTYYLLKEDRKEWLFTLAMWGTAFPLMPAFYTLSTVPYTELLAFFAGAALCFVGAAPEFKFGSERFVHICATVICALSSQIWVAIYDPWLLLLWLLPVVGLGYKAVQNILKNRRDNRLTQYPSYWSRPLFYRTNPLFWIEVTAFGVTFLALLF